MEVSLSNKSFLFKIILFFLWLIVQVGLYVRLGVQTSVDSLQYIEDANSILSGILPGGRSTWYLGYTSFLALIFSLGGSLKSVVVLQMLLSGFAAAGVYIITTHIFNKELSSSLAVFIYLAWIKIHEWNTFIYTESFFTSLTIIAIALLFKSEALWHFILAFLLIVFTFFIRPTGFAFVAGVMIYLLKMLSERRQKKVLVMLSMILGIGWIFLLDKMMVDYPLLDSYIKGEIIYPDINFGIEIPPALFLPAEDHSPFIRWILFIWGNPFFCFKLFVIKLLLFFGNVKPYFSWFHNIMIVVVLYPLYFFAIKGFRKLSVNNRAKYFILTYVVVQGLTVALTSENWDGRFLIPVLPFVFILSAGGVNSTISKNFV